MFFIGWEVSFFFLYLKLKKKKLKTTKKKNQTTDKQPKEVTAGKGQAELVIYCW